MPKIGIFWIHHGKILGKACELEEGESSIANLIDSPDNHIDLWECDPDFLSPFPALRSLEYQQVPRGRVLFSTHNNTALVYMDKTLYTSADKHLIMDFFGLQNVKVIWKTDPHYTTVDQDIDGLLDE
jgi:hypothetical protein